MDFLRKFGFFFLLLGVLSDFLTPYVLGLYYPELDQMKSVISVFGEVSSPVRKAFLIWSVVSGIFFILSLPALYAAFVSTSRVLATLVTAAIAFYGIGDCIFTGLFSINTHESSWNVSTWVHNIGSGLGYSGFSIVSSSSFLDLSKKWANGRKPLIPWTVCDQFAFCGDLWTGKNSFYKFLAITE